VRLDPRQPTRAPAPTVIASYCGANDGIDRAMVTFARAYADQVERDRGAVAPSRRGPSAETGV
jgi:hypothetical protein